MSMLLLTVGCAPGITPASPHRGTGDFAVVPLPADAWPERYPEQLVTLLKKQEEAAQIFDATGEKMEAPFHPGILSIFRVAAMNASEESRRIYGRGLIHPIGRSTQGYPVFMYVTNRLPPDQFASLKERDALLEDPHEDVLLRWRFIVQPPLNEASRGLVVHLPSIGNRRYENAVNDALRRRGWAVLTAMPPGLMIRIIESGEDVTPPIVTTGDTLASRLDAFAADYAYAVEGMLAYLREHHPTMKTSPLVIAGYSGGALALGPVAARLVEHVDAAILVGGGANVADILLTSSVANLGYRIRTQHGAKVADQLADLPQAYLAASTFDPFHTAPQLVDVPILMLDGSFDHVIPERNRVLLYERLGQPELWSYPVGHVMLFLLLPSQANRIARWLEQTLPPHEMSPAERCGRDKPAGTM